MKNKNEYLKQIESNIKEYGYHLYGIVDAGALPRFFYSIGLSKTIGKELIFAGALLYTDEEVQAIIEETLDALKKDNHIDNINTSLGLFSLKNVDPSWSKELMLEALDYYDVSSIDTLQIVPTDDYYLTIDVPNLANAYTPTSEPIWKWLTKEWSYTIPKSSVCITDLNVLRGKSIIQAIRWEDEYWEAFSKPASEILEEETRLVPLGMLLAVDTSNEVFEKLDVNEAVSRVDTTHEWEFWSVEE